MSPKIVHFILAVLILVSLSNIAFAQADQKAAYGILIDNTGSMRSQFDLVIDLSKGIVAETHQRGPISLFHFMTQGSQNQVAVVSSDTGWTQSRPALDSFLDGMFVVPGQTTLRDGLNTIAEQLNARTSVDKDVVVKNIVLISDGEDRVSKISEKELIKVLNDSGIKVYAIGLVKEIEKEGGQKKATAFLEKLAKETGGRAVFPKSKQVDVESVLKQLFTQ